MAEPEIGVSKVTEWRVARPGFDLTPDLKNRDAGCKFPSKVQPGSSFHPFGALIFLESGPAPEILQIETPGEANIDKRFRCINTHNVMTGNV